MDIDKIVQILMKAKEAYYNDEPIMSDIEFDELEEKLKELDPDNSYFDIVGIKVQGEKIRHEIPMLSMNKAKSVDDVVEWLNKITDKRLALICEPKIDGMSASIIYENSKLRYIVSRGDGKEGRNITHIADYINIPKTIDLNDRVEVRGELYIPKNSNFKNPENKPLRNLCTGLINRKDKDLDDLKYVKFISYQIFGSEYNTEEDKIELLRLLGFETVFYTKILSIFVLKAYFERYKAELRDKWEYETDGLIFVVNDNSFHEIINSKYVVSHHNHYNIALKPPSESKWTIVKDITWQISRNGMLIPVVNIESINIGGATIKNVTANNYANVKKLKINKGDRIHVARSNDVIPFLIEVENVKDESELIPTNCPNCNSILDYEGVHLVCKNEECDEQEIQKIISWVKENDMDQVAESSIRSLYENKYINSIIDLYDLKYMSIDLEGFGEKKISNLIYQIEKSKSMSIVEFLSRLSIKLVGEKAIKKLGIKSINDFWKFDDNRYVIGQNLIEYRDKNKEFIMSLLDYLHVYSIKEEKNKEKVCMTGKGHKSRKELIKEIEDKGYEFESSINKDIKILICEDLNGSSSKLKKAKSLGITLMKYEDFFQGE